MSEKKRGGYRENAKRPKKKESEKLIKRQIFFTLDQLKKAKGQNLSKLVRKLIDEWQPQQIGDTSTLGTHEDICKDL
jgi:DNA phosphorothioation-dependent restriction protein DptG